MYDDHETRIVREMKLREAREAVEAAATVGQQVAAFYWSLRLNRLPKQLVGDLAHQFLAELMAAGRGERDCEECMGE